MKPVVDAYIGLGSNMGDRGGTIEAALSALDAASGVSLDVVSSLIETEPVGPVHQPLFLNGVARLRTVLEAGELLRLLLKIERNQGRDRTTGQRWGPRPLDLDLLFYGSQVINEAGLTVPHPRLVERLFVLGPLVEIAPDLVHPVLDRSVATLLDELAVDDPARRSRHLRT